jgi:hypothetical protein
MTCHRHWLNQSDREGWAALSTAHERYLVNEERVRVGVLLDPKEYERLLPAWEELESIRTYDAAKALRETQSALWRRRPDHRARSS